MNHSQCKRITYHDADAEHEAVGERILAMILQKDGKYVTTSTIRQQLNIIVASKRSKQNVRFSHVHPAEIDTLVPKKQQIRRLTSAQQICLDAYLLDLSTLDLAVGGALGPAAELPRHADAALDGGRTIGCMCTFTIYQMQDQIADSRNKVRFHVQAVVTQHQHKSI